MKTAFLKTTAMLLIMTFGNIVQAEEKVSFRSNFFSDNSGTSVQSPSLEIWKHLVGELVFKLRYMVDRVNIPPIRGITAAPTPTDGITGASRPIGADDPANLAWTKQRNEVTAAVELPGVKASYYHSDEIDYVGRLAGASLNFDMNRKNTNVATGYSYGWDTIAPLGQDTVHTLATHSVNLTITQVLTPKTIARLGADVSYVSGFQSNPYRTVFAGDIVYEQHPRKRTRGALFVNLNHYLETRTALNVEYRYYADDWEVKSHTIGTYFYQYFSQNFLFRWRYRYYDQTAASFYAPIYAGGEQFLTSDYKLEAFNAHLFGFKIEYKLHDLVKNGFFNFLSSSTFEAKYERYFSSNKFTADIYQFALVVNY
jgi:hypothetical protein